MFKAIVGLTAFAATVASAAIYMEGIKKNIESIKDDIATVNEGIGSIKDDIATVNEGIGSIKDDVATVDSIRSDTEDMKRVQNSVQQALSSFGQPNSFGTRYKWEKGDVPVEMIARNEGLCYIVFFEGSFEGDKESVSIYVENDAWFLKGNPEGNSIVAEAQCWRFPAIQQ